MQARNAMRLEMRAAVLDMDECAIILRQPLSPRFWMATRTVKPGENLLREASPDTETSQEGGDRSPSSRSPRQAEPVGPPSLSPGSMCDKSSSRGRSPEKSPRERGSASRNQSGKSGPVTPNFNWPARTENDTTDDDEKEERRARASRALSPTAQRGSPRRTTRTATRQLKINKDPSTIGRAK